MENVGWIPKTNMRIIFTSLTFIFAKFKSKFKAKISSYQFKTCSVLKIGNSLQWPKSLVGLQHQRLFQNAHKVCFKVVIKMVIHITSKHQLYILTSECVQRTFFWLNIVFNVVFCRIPLLNNSIVFYFNMLYYKLVKYWNDTMAYKGDN